MSDPQWVNRGSATQNLPVLASALGVSISSAGPTLTANGAGETTVSPGEYVTLNWSSTNAASATATIAPDSPDTCKTKLALSVTKGSGSYKLGPITGASL